MSREFTIGYGPIADSIAEQLAVQGLEVPDVEKYEKFRFAINTLYLSDILIESQKDKCLERLHKRITKEVREKKS